MVKKFDLEYPERFEKEIFDYLSIHPEQFGSKSKLFQEPIMNREYFADITDNFRSPHIWYKGKDGWNLRNTLS